MPFIENNIEIYPELLNTCVIKCFYDNSMSLPFNDIYKLSDLDIC